MSQQPTVLLISSSGSMPRAYGAVTKSIFGRTVRPATVSSEYNDRAVVHIVDDDEGFRSGLASLFRALGLEAHTYGSAGEFVNAGKPDAPGCIVLDVRLPGMSGIEFQSQLSDLGISLPVILTTAYGDIPMAVGAMKAGAVDFLPKPFREQDMLDAVNAAIDLDRDRRATEHREGNIQERFATLSPREKQVMMLVTDGKLNKQVAGDLGLSEITVKVHRSSAMRKMGVRVFTEFVRAADAVRMGMAAPYGP